MELLVNFASDTPKFVVGDPGRVRQIIFNLVGNAIKFTEKGHVLINVSGKKGKENTVRLSFEIEDTGIGIPKNKQKHIFSKFSQAEESTTRKFGGTGLGLTICKSLIEMMGGSVGLKSEQGKGATFYFDIILLAGKEEKEEGQIPEFDLKNIRSLIVDDYKLNREILYQYMHEWGMRCDVFSSAEDALEAMKKAAKEKASQAKSAFLANMSHELRTLLNGVLGVSVLLEDTELNSEQRNYIAVIRKSGNMLLEVINNILDFSKIEAGEFNLEPINFNLYTAIKETADTLMIQAWEKGIELLVDFDEKVPRYYIGDVERICHIILNLLSNAIKFTSKGYVLLSVKYQDLKNGSAKLYFEVEDTGIGIPSEKQDYIFNEFSQVEESTTRKFNGTGLGIAICRSLTHMMNGNIDARSIEGKGSVFSFDITLPFGTEVPDGKLVRSPTLDFKKLRVLVVDDMKVNLMLVAKILKKRGCSVDTATNGIEALNMLKNSLMILFLWIVTCQKWMGMRLHNLSVL